MSDDCYQYPIDINDFEACNYNKTCIEALKVSNESCTEWIHVDNGINIYSLPMDFGLYCEQQWSVVLFFTVPGAYTLFCIC